MDLRNRRDDEEDSSSTSSKVEPGELLEESWFFGNLLDRKTRMSRCFSDPCPSSKVSQEMLVGKSYEETYSSINKVFQPSDDEFTATTTPAPQPRPSLIKAPSMPSPNSRTASVNGQPQLIRGGSKQPLLRRSSNLLQRAPSLPAADMDFEDEESDYSMGKLIRQASLGQSDMLPPRRTPKSMIPATVPKYRPRRKPEAEGWSEESRRRQHSLNNQGKIKKSLADLESEEVRGFKELGFSFDNKELSPKVVKILPGLQEKKKKENEEEEEEERHGSSNKARRPYLSEAWESQRSGSPVLNNIGRQGSSEDMKAQIKYWARAVASNVR